MVSPIPGWRTPIVVIVAGCLISMIGFGVRAIMGLFLEPMTVTQGWTRETFALAMAIQNLVWGFGVPIAGAIADKFGPSRVIAIGALIYASGVIAMAMSESAFMLQLTGGLLLGVGVAFTSFSLALAAMAQVVSEAQRGFALGLGTAFGSVGQIVFSPITNGMIESLGWYDALVWLSIISLLLFPLAFALPSGPSKRASGAASDDQTLRSAIAEARSHRGYVLLTLGFFVCGFHVTFIAVHFPAYVIDVGLAPSVGANALAIVGIFNIVGAIGAGVLAKRWTMKNCLAVIYFLRSIAIVGLLLAPPTVTTIYVFSMCIGLLWLSTVPLTTNIVAQVFGVRYLATLFGFVFLSHQLGSFLGVWLGGIAFDQTGSYDLVWQLGIVLGVAAALVHLPIDERPLIRLGNAQSAA